MAHEEEAPALEHYVIHLEGNDIESNICVIDGSHVDDHVEAITTKGVKLTFRIYCIRVSTYGCAFVMLVDGRVVLKSLHDFQSRSAMQVFSAHVRFFSLSPMFSKI